MYQMEARNGYMMELESTEHMPGVNLFEKKMGSIKEFYVSQGWQLEECTSGYKFTDFTKRWTHYFFLNGEKVVIDNQLAYTLFKSALEPNL